MSTRCYIAQKINDNLYNYVYSHWDGYPTTMNREKLNGVGKKLFENYNTPEKVTELIAMGNISSLGINIDETVSYFKMRNDPIEIGTFNSINKDEIGELFKKRGIEYMYLFDNKILEWYYTEYDLNFEFKLLSEATNPKAEKVISK